MSASDSIWTPLRLPVFRGIWTSGAVYFIGNAMQTMAAAWLMVELTGSSFLAALVQTAVFLPMFLLALPAGVLADTTDRRRLMRASLLTQVGIVLLLALLVALGHAGPAVLLVFTFVSGCCTALLSPAWNTTVADAVPRDELPQAITAVAIAFNAARALGPALAGVVFAVAGGAWVFFLAVGCVLGMLYALRRWPPRPHPASKLPAERLWGGTLSGLRFARHSKLILAQLVRTVAFGGTGSALWALLPVIGQRQLGLGAEGFGLLMGCLGGGAVAAGLVIGPLRARAGLEKVVGVSCIVFALVMVIAAVARSPWPVYAALLFGGAAWMATMSTFNTATQTSAPPWVRSRATALHTLCALGSFAIGSALWGLVSALAGLPITLCLAATCMAAGVFLAKPFPLRMGAAPEVTQATPWEDLFVVDEPEPEEGPVAVEIGYRIRPHDAPAFLEALSELKAPRRRDGATFWRVYRDLSDPSHYAERFIVTSWAEYLHQRARATLADQELEGYVRRFMLPGETVRVQHFIAER
ncbi:MFS transporter [Piscinibacter sp.]|uniref:MFS transporter n=1 Tax=Piscinibacter sp. TaxID=1903157 RepID=UPI002CFF8A1E|nr:MFS transporter [Albitalea sp.]HUG26033.1 MFS transporter [Albitalea sp.]